MANNKAQILTIAKGIVLHLEAAVYEDGYNAGMVEEMGDKIRLLAWDDQGFPPFGVEPNVSDRNQAGTSS